MRITEFRFKLYPQDFDKVRQFYADVMQFPVVQEWNRAPDNRGVMFDVGGTVLELLSPEHEHTRVQGADLSLEVGDVHGLWEQFKDTQSIGHPLRHNSWGDTSFQIIDPEGLKISLFTRDA